MAKYLVIVESPAKVKTIKKFLGANYEVMASNGHVRDFPKSQFGIDVDHDYEPKYITIRGKGEILAKLRKEAKKADKVYLATDPDREGEAISWHLSKALGLEDKKMYRITFNEITKTAVKESLKHARQIDMDLVDAQQARRMVDRMVGYRISPLLWAKVKRGLSAGRVQSAALRIIADREEEINAFVPEEYWSLDAQFKVTGEKKPVTAKFYGTTKEKMEIHSREEMDQVLAALKDAAFSVTDVKKGERTKKAPLPFTTSTLQQEASKVLNFSTSKTMRLAQQLYEGIDIEGQGTVGVITYLRTDSTRVSDEAAAQDYVDVTNGGRLDWSTQENKEKIAKIVAEIEAQAKSGFNILNYIKATFQGKVDASASAELTSAFDKTIKNTLLTDYIQAASKDEHVKKFENSGVYAPENSVTLYKMLSSYLTIVPKEEIPIDMEKLNEAILGERGYYDMLLKTEKERKSILRFNLQAFKNNYNLVDLSKMKLTYFGIKVGTCGENHLSIDKEFDFQPAEDKTTAEEIVEGEKSVAEEEKELDVYDIVLAGVVREED